MPSGFIVIHVGELRRDRDRDDAPSQYRPKRKKGFLSEVFEFGD